MAAGARSLERRGNIRLLCAAAAVAVSGTAALGTIGFNHWQASALVRIDSAAPMATVASGFDPEFVFVPAEAFFDGAYFYTIALDPFARGEFHQLIDRFEYRYGHPGYGWLARLFAVGDPDRLPESMLFVGLVGMAIAGWAVGGIAVQLGRSPWWGLSVAVNPGLVLAVTLDTSEPIGIAFAAAGVYLWLWGRPVGAAVLFASACLVKEPFVLVPAGLFAWEAIQLVRRPAAPNAKVRLLALAASGLPLTLWYAYLKVHLGVFPFQRAPDFFGVPLAGWFDSFRQGVGLMGTGASQLGNIAITLLTILGAAMLVGAVRAVGLRSPFDLMFLAAALLASLYNWHLLLYPKDVLRELILPLLLIPAVVGSVRWRVETPTSPAVQAEDGEEEAAEDRLRSNRDGRR
jgi:hypothetical protein